MKSKTNFNQQFEIALQFARLKACALNYYFREFLEFHVKCVKSLNLRVNWIFGTAGGSITNLQWKFQQYFRSLFHPSFWIPEFATYTHTNPLSRSRSRSYYIQSFVQTFIRYVLCIQFRLGYIFSSISTYLSNWRWNSMKFSHRYRIF